MPFWKRRQPRETTPLGEVLERIRAKHALPALAAAVVRDGRTAEIGAVGVRRWGAEVPVTPDDRFHLGSCTKAMTATLIGMLVEEKGLAWDTTLAAALPDLARTTMHPGWRNVTVDHLLAHRAGLPARSWPQGKTFEEMHRLPGAPRDQRWAYVAMFLREKPENPPGSRYVYANAGYAALGAIAERITDTAWETLLARRVFEPLGMRSAGFGAMGTPGKIEQPWQHREGKPPAPVEPGPLSDNPAVIGPGGTVHSNLGDWATFVAAHVREGRVGLLRPETFRKLHTPAFGGDYAGGWIVTERGWGGGRVLTHAGSNTMNYAVVWAAPSKDFAVMAATNVGGDRAARACDAAAAAMIGRVLKA